MDCGRAPGGIATGSAGTNVVRGTERPSPPATHSRANVSKLGRRYRPLRPGKALSGPCSDRTSRPD
jgi:hypothetical protein